MADLALLPDITLPRSLDDVRNRLLAHAAVDECSILVPDAHTVDEAVLNPELAAKLVNLGALDLIVAVGHTADAAVAGRGGSQVILIDPPLNQIVLRSRPLGSSIQRVGSCGSCGRPSAFGPKKTWWMKRSE